MVVLDARPRHIKGVSANDPSNRELLLLRASLLVLGLERVLRGRQSGASAKARMLVGRYSLLHAAHEVTWRVISPRDVVSLPIFSLRNRGVLGRELLEPDDHG